MTYALYTKYAIEASDKAVPRGAELQLQYGDKIQDKVIGWANAMEAEAAMGQVGRPLVITYGEAGQVSYGMVVVVPDGA